jgi:all-trans-retinol dehydrogenase (NAD+)
VSAAANEVRFTFGKPSILINNAGIGASHPILSANLDMVRKTIAVNLTSHWYTCGAFVPDMVKANKGHVVTLASVASFITLAGTVDYAATKAGVLTFHE